jgi:uncharacterized membrane protein YidH (DUF202 family)
VIEAGLQAERTALAWTRTSFAVLGNGALLTVREGLTVRAGHTVQPAAVALAVATAVTIYLIGRQRQRTLANRPLPQRITARWQVIAVAVTVLALIGVTAVGTLA